MHFCFTSTSSLTPAAGSNGLGSSEQQYASRVHRHSTTVPPPFFRITNRIYLEFTSLLGSCEILERFGCISHVFALLLDFRRLQLPRAASLAHQGSERAKSIDATPAGGDICARKKYPICPTKPALFSGYFGRNCPPGIESAQATSKLNRTLAFFVITFLLYCFIQPSIFERKKIRTMQRMYTHPHKSF